MKKGFWNKRIPTILAFVLLFASIWVTTFLIQTGIIVVGRASPDKTPENVTVSNITDSSFTVSFTSTAKTVSAVDVKGPNNFSNLSFDNRDKDGSGQTAFYSHHITIDNLQPETSYNFSILSDGETYLNNGRNYTVKTGPEIEIPPSQQNPIKGKVLLPNGEPASDTIVKLTSENAQTITTLTTNSGQYTIPTSSIRTKDLSDYVIFDEREILFLELFRENMSSNIRLIFGNSQSIPTITLLENYSFESETPTTATATQSSQLEAQESVFGSYNVEITSPEPSSSITDNRPLFRGTAAPNQTVKITIQSNPIQAEVQSSSNGQWTYRPSDPLAPGQHTITIETVDGFGILRKITQSFTVHAEGSQIEQSATPSATITPAPTSTPAITPTATPTPTPTTSASEKGGVVEEASPTATITPTTTPTVPPVGNLSQTLVLTITSIILIISGSALLFFL